MAQPRNDFILTDTDQEHLDWTNQVGSRMQEVFNVKDYGATGDGIVDDTASLQAAHDAAEVGFLGGIVLYPPGAYRTTATVRLRGAYVRLVGTQPRRSRIVADDSVTGPILQIEGIQTSQFYGVENLSIEGSGAGGSGQHGIELWIQSGTGRVISNSWIRDCWIREQGGWGVSLNNQRYNPATGADADGLFQFYIGDSVIENGIDLTYGGDSIWVERNTITGENAGVLYDGVRGGKLLYIQNNIILNSGGGIHVVGGVEVRILDNHIELKTNPTTAPGDAVIYVEGSSEAAGNAVDVQILRNNIDAGLRYTTGVDYNVRVADADRTLIADNYILLAATSGILIDSGATGTRVGYNTWIDDSDFSFTQPDISDSGTTTIAIGSHGVYTDASRPTASGLPAGFMIWNSDDGFPNWSDGTNWVTADGTTT